MLAAHLDEGLVGALHDALAADVDPRAGGHLAVHHQALAIELVEMLPGRPVRHEVGVGDQHARRIGMGAEHADRLAGLHQQRLVVFELAQRGDDAVEALPVARRAADAAIDHELAAASRRPRDRGCSSACAAAPRSASSWPMSSVPRGARIGAGVVEAAWSCGSSPVRVRGSISAPARRDERRRGGPARRRAAMVGMRSGGRRRDAALRGARSARTASSGALECSGAWKSQPCAAASSSMPMTASAFSVIGQQAARAVRRHRDVVFLVGRGRDRIDAGRMGALLVLRHQRRRRDLRDHEAGIEARASASGTPAGRTAPGRPAWRCAARRASRSRRSPARSCRRRRPPARRGSCRRTAPRRSSAKISGLSVTPLASVSSVVAAWRSRSSTAPMTCGWQRRQ